MSVNATYGVSIDSSGAVAGAQMFNTAQQSMTRGASTLDSALASISGRLTGFAIAAGVAFLGREMVQGVKNVIAASDSFTLLKGRMEASLGSADAARGAMNDLGGVAGRTRTSVTDLAETYLSVRTGLVALGRSEQDAMGITESLTQLMKLGGLSAGETAKQVRTFTFALAETHVSGGQFRSMIEKTPELLRILQDETGKSAKELFALANAGVISGKTISQALLNSADDIKAKFAKLPANAGEAFGLMADEVHRYTGQAAEASGVSKAWADVANKLREVVAGEAFQSGLKATTDAVASLGRGAKDIIDTFRGANTATREWLDALSNTGTFKTIAGFMDYVSRSAAGIAGLMPTEKTVAMITAEVARGAKTLKALMPGSDTASLVAGDAAERAKKSLEFAPDMQAAVIKGMRIQGELTGAQIGMDGERTRALELQLVKQRAVTDELRATRPELAAQIEAQAVLNKQLEQAKEAQALGDQVGLRRLQNDLIKAQIGGDKDIIQAVETQIAVQQGVTREMRLQHPELAKELTGQIAVGVQMERNKAAAEEWRSLGESMSAAWVDGFKSMAASGDSFGKTLAKIALKMAELLAQKALFDPVGKAFGNYFATTFGGGTGGPGGWLTQLSVPGFAKGDVFDSPVMLSAPGGFRSQMAESGPEAVMPLTRGPDGKLGVAASGGSSGGSVTNVHFNVAGDATDATIARMREMAQQVFAQNSPGLIKSSVGAVRREIVRDPGFTRR